MLYFAYGENMDEATLVARGVQFSRVCTGKVRNLRLVFQKPGEDGAQENERNIDERGILQPHRALRRPLGEGLCLAGKRAEQRKSNDPGRDELNDADSEVTDPGLDRDSPLSGARRRSDGDGEQPMARRATPPRRGPPPSRTAAKRR